MNRRGNVFIYVLCCLGPLIYSHASFAATINIDGQTFGHIQIQFPSNQNVEKIVEWFIDNIKRINDIEITRKVIAGSERFIRIVDKSGDEVPVQQESNLNDIYDDGFRLIIGAGPKVLIEALNPLGLVYGLTELMEIMGFRFYMPGPYGTVYPDRDINLNAGEILSNPAFRYRGMGTGAWSLTAYRANVNLKGLPSEHGRAVWGLFHTFELLLPEEEYFSSHPEYYGQRTFPFARKVGARQLATENPEVIEIVGQKLAQLAGSRKYELLTLAPNDHRKFDFSFSLQHLAELFRPFDEMLSKRMLTFYRQVAKRYRELGGEIPIRIGAYDIYTAPPEQDNVPLDSLLIPYVAHFDYCQLHPIEDTDCPPNLGFANILKRWSNMSRSLYVYEYPYKHNWLELPWPVYINTVSNIRYISKLGAKGYHAQFSEANAFSNLLNYYITAKALWNPSVDYHVLRKEFFQLFYKEASVHMENCYTVLEEEFHRHPLHVSGNAIDNFSSVFSKSALELSLVMADKAFARATDPVVKVRVSMMKCWLEYSLAMRALLSGEADADQVAVLLAVINHAAEEHWPILDKNILFRSPLISTLSPCSLAQTSDIRDSSTKRYEGSR
jgi:hypothetical protein